MMGSKIDKNTVSEQEIIQEANSFLRERYLYLISTLCGEKCKESTIRLYENTTINAKIKAFDLDFENIIVEDLKTPQGEQIDRAILRTNDILTITYEQ